MIDCARCLEDCVNKECGRGSVSDYCIKLKLFEIEEGDVLENCMFVVGGVSEEINYDSKGYVLFRSLL